VSELDLFAEPAPEPAAPEGGPGPRYATVAVDAPVPGGFTYTVPPALRSEVRVGVRVRVPFGGRSVSAFVLDLPETTDVPAKKLRPVQEVTSPEPAVSPEVLELARWAAAYYDAPLGEVLAAAVPGAVDRRSSRPDPSVWLRRTEAEASGRLGGKQRAVLAALAGGPRPLAVVREESGADLGVVRRLEERGLVALADPPPPEPFDPGDLPEPTAEQRLAIAPLLRQLEAGEGGATLLFGVTGSGKTEVYLRAIARALELGRGAIVLVPEIALTPQTLARFRDRFGDRVAVLHSQLAAGERRREWRRLQRGEARVAVGPRSAVWAPVADLGLIVVDEEHETTYKQESSPRYHARDLAVVRAKQAGIPVVLGSATPSLESWANAARGRYRVARLRTRPGGSVLPRVVVVDMGEEYAEVKGAPLLSRRLVQELERALARGEQALLFQNRRGFTTFLQCPGCGHVLKCRQCDVTLTFHRSARATLCHFCDLREAAPGGPCPSCLGPPLRQRGAGTERIEDVVRQLLPEAAVGRLDTDVVRGGDSAEDVIDRFRRGELQVLVGTQMIAKGLDIPAVTVVGVISADTSLSLPDFRSAERTFQLVAQVAGRAGRGQREGVTVVQTFLPGHFAVAAAAGHRYEAFADEELRAREALGYPPHRRLLKVLLRGPDERLVEDEAVALADAIRAATREDPAVDGVLGPAPSPRAYLAGKFRWQLLVKGSHPGLRRAIACIRGRKAPSRLELVLDVDPYHLL